MSYADLKPVKFEDSNNIYTTLHPVHESYHHYTYAEAIGQNTSISEYFTPYTANGEQHYYDQPHQQHHHHQQHPHQHHQHHHQHPHHNQHSHHNSHHVVHTPVQVVQMRQPQNMNYATPAPPMQQHQMQQPTQQAATGPTPKSKKIPRVQKKGQGQRTVPRAASTGASSEGSEELSEDLRNHWLPMTWIERSSDDDSTFNFVCLWDECVDITGSKQEFVDHMYMHIDNLAQHMSQYPSSSCTCLVRGCNKVLSGIQELQRHMTMHIFQADCQQKGSEALIEKEEFSGVECCGFTISTSVHYEGEVLICQWENCGVPFTSLTDLFDHAGQHVEMMTDLDRVDRVLDTGERKTVYPCKWTGCASFSEAKCNLRRHLRHHSGEKVIACPFCAKFFSRKDKLYDHCIRRTLLTNEREEPYSCKLCQKSFGTEKALCMHVTRHLVAHTCPLCSLSVAARADLHRHLMSKHSSRTKEHKCDSCTRCFFSESELARHSVVHTDVMYNCRSCPEKFRWKKQLLKHMKEHDECLLQNFNPTPYVCHFCEKSYTTGFALGRHLTKAHNCSVPYGFSRFTYKKCADGLMRLQTKKIFKPEDQY